MRYCPLFFSAVLRYASTTDTRVPLFNEYFPIWESGRVPNTSPWTQNIGVCPIPLRSKRAD